MSFSDVQWGTAADWAAAIGTVLAFGAALWVIYRERVDRKLEELRRREEDSRRRRAQAQSIAVWLEGELMPDGSQENDDTIVKIRNVSGSPVDNCVAHVLHPIGGPNDDPEHPDHARWEVHIGTLPPGETISDTVSRDWINPELIVFPGLVAQVAFTDSEGVHWMRQANGTLEERESPPRMC